MARKGGGFRLKTGLQSDAGTDELFFMGLKGFHRWEYRHVVGGASHTDYQVEENRWLGFFIHDGVLKWGWRAERKNYSTGALIDYAGTMEAVPGVALPAYSEGNTATTADREDYSRPLLEKVDLAMIVLPQVSWYSPFFTWGDRVATFYANGQRLVESDVLTFWGTQIRFSAGGLFGESVSFYEDDNSVWEQGLVFECLTPQLGGSVSSQAVQVEVYDALVYYD